MDRRGRRATPKCSLKKKPFKRAKQRKNDITPGLKAYKKVDTLGKGSKKLNGNLKLNFPLCQKKLSGTPPLNVVF